ncbi:MAG: hypothetical protein ACRCV3_00420 [Desulfovibrionaceae bacterium]
MINHINNLPIIKPKNTITTVESTSSITPSTTSCAKNTISHLQAEFLKQSPVINISQKTSSSQNIPFSSKKIQKRIRLSDEDKQTLLSQSKTLEQVKELFAEYQNGQAKDTIQEASLSFIQRKDTHLEEINKHPESIKHSPLQIPKAYFSSLQEDIFTHEASSSSKSIENTSPLPSSSTGSHMTPEEILEFLTQENIKEKEQQEQRKIERQRRTKLREQRRQSYVEGKTQKVREQTQSSFALSSYIQTLLAGSFSRAEVIAEPKSKSIYKTAFYMDKQATEARKEDQARQRQHEDNQKNPFKYYEKHSSTRATPAQIQQEIQQDEEAANINFDEEMEKTRKALFPSNPKKNKKLAQLYTDQLAQYYDLTISTDSKINYKKVSTLKTMLLVGMQLTAHIAETAQTISIESKLLHQSRIQILSEKLFTAYRNMQPEEINKIYMLHILLAKLQNIVNDSNSASKDKEEAKELLNKIEKQMHTLLRTIKKLTKDAPQEAYDTVKEEGERLSQLFYSKVLMDKEERPIVQEQSSTSTTITTIKEVITIGEKVRSIVKQKKNITIEQEKSVVYASNLFDEEGNTSFPTTEEMDMIEEILMDVDEDLPQEAQQRTNEFPPTKEEESVHSKETPTKQSNQIPHEGILSEQVEVEQVIHIPQQDDTAEALNLQTTPHIVHTRVRNIPSQTQVPEEDIFKEKNAHESTITFFTSADAAPIPTERTATIPPVEHEYAFEDNKNPKGMQLARKRRAPENLLKPLNLLIRDIHRGIKSDPTLFSSYKKVNDYIRIHGSGNMQDPMFNSDFMKLIAEVKIVFNNNPKVNILPYYGIFTSVNHLFSKEDFRSFDIHNLRDPEYLKIHNDIISGTDPHNEIDMSLLLGYNEHADNHLAKKSLYTILNMLMGHDPNIKKYLAKLSATNKIEYMKHFETVRNTQASNVESQYLSSSAGSAMEKYNLPSPVKFSQSVLRPDLYWDSRGICRLLSTIFVETMNRNHDIGERIFKSILINIESIAQNPDYVRALNAINADYQIPEQLIKEQIFTKIPEYLGKDKGSLLYDLFNIDNSNLKKNQAYTLSLDGLAHSTALYREIVIDPATNSKMIVVRYFDPNIGIYSFTDGNELGAHIDRTSQLLYKRIPDTLSLGGHNSEALRMYGTRYKGVSYNKIIENKFINNPDFIIPLDKEVDINYQLQLYRARKISRFSLTIKESAISLRSFVNRRLASVSAKNNPAIEASLKNLRRVLRSIQALNIQNDPIKTITTLYREFVQASDALPTEYADSLGEFLTHFKQDLSGEIRSRITATELFNNPSLADFPNLSLSVQQDSFDEMPMETMQEQLMAIQNAGHEIEDSFKEILEANSLEEMQYLSPEIEDILHTSTGLEEIELLTTKNHVEVINTKTGNTKNIALTPVFKEKVLQYLKTIKGTALQVGGVALEGYSYYSCFRILLAARNYFDRGKVFDKMTTLQKLRYAGEGASNVLFVSSTVFSALGRLLPLSIGSSMKLAPIAHGLGNAAMGVNVGLSALRVLEASKSLQEHPNYMAKVEIGFASADLSINLIIAVAPETAIFLVPAQAILGVIEETLRKDAIAKEHKEYLKALSLELKRRAENLENEQIIFKNNMAIIPGENSDIIEITLRDNKLIITVEDISGVGYEAASYRRSRIPCNLDRNKYAYSPRPNNGPKQIVFPKKSCVAKKNVKQVLHCMHSVTDTQIQEKEEHAVNTVKEYLLPQNIEIIVPPMQYQYTILMQEISTYHAKYNHPDLVLNEIQQTYGYCSGFNPALTAKDGGEVISVPVSANMISAIGPTINTKEFSENKLFYLKDATLNLEDDIKYETYTERVRVHYGADKIRSHTHLHLYRNVEKQREVSRKKVYVKEVGHELSIKLKINVEDYILPQTSFIGNSNFSTQINLNRGHYIRLNDHSENNKGFIVKGYLAANGGELVHQLDLRDDGRIIIQLLDPSNNDITHQTYVDITHTHSQIVYISSHGLFYEYDRNYKALRTISFDGSLVSEQFNKKFDTADSLADFMCHLTKEQSALKNSVFQLTNLLIAGELHKEGFYFSRIHRRDKPTVVYLNWPENMQHADDYELIHVEDTVLGYDVFKNMDLDNYVSYFYSPTDRRIIRQVRDNLIEENDIIPSDQEPQKILLTNGDKRLLLRGHTSGFDEHGELQEVYMDYTQLQEEEKSKLNELILQHKESISHHHNGRIIVANIPYHHQEMTTTELPDRTISPTSRVQSSFTLKFDTNTGKALPILKDAFGIPAKLITLSTVEGDDTSSYAYYFVQKSNSKHGHILAIKNIDMDLLVDHKWLSNTELLLQGYTIFQDKEIKNAFSYQREIFFETSDGAILKGYFDGKQEISSLVSLTEEYFHHYNLNLNEDTDIIQAFNQALLQYSRPLSILSQIRCNSESEKGEIWYNQNAQEVIRVHTELIKVEHRKDKDILVKASTLPSDMIPQDKISPMVTHKFLGYIKEGDTKTACIWDSHTKTYVMLPEDPSIQENIQLFPLKALRIIDNQAFVEFDPSRFSGDTPNAALAPVFPGVTKVIYQNMVSTDQRNAVTYKYTKKSLLPLEEISIDARTKDTQPISLDLEINLSSFRSLIPYTLENDSHLYLRIRKALSHDAKPEYFTLILKNILHKNTIRDNVIPNIGFIILGNRHTIPKQLFGGYLKHFLDQQAAYFRNKDGNIQRLLHIKREDIPHKPLTPTRQKSLDTFYRTHNPLRDKNRPFDATIDMQKIQHPSIYSHIEEDACDSIKRHFAKQGSSFSEPFLVLAPKDSQLHTEIRQIIASNNPIHTKGNTSKKKKKIFKQNNIRYESDLLMIAHLKKDAFNTLFYNNGEKDEETCQQLIYDPALSVQYAQDHLIEYTDAGSVEPWTLFPERRNSQDILAEKPEDRFSGLHKRKDSEYIPIKTIYTSTSEQSAVTKVESRYQKKKDPQKLPAEQCPPNMHLIAANLLSNPPNTANNTTIRIISKIPLATGLNLRKIENTSRMALTKYCPESNIINVKAVYSQSVGSTEETILPVSHLVRAFKKILDSTSSSKTIYLVYPNAMMISNTKLTNMLNNYITKLEEANYSIIVDTQNRHLDGRDPLQQISVLHNNLYIVLSMEEAITKNLLHKNSD